MKVTASCARFGLVLVLTPLCVQGAVRQPPPRDVARAPNASRSCSISGRVIAADTRRPLSEALVTLSSAPPPDVPGTGVTYSRQHATNAQGAFEFKNIPPGAYRLRGAPGVVAQQYLAMSYGARRPTADIGDRIVLEPGQVIENVTIVLPRGAVISGRITDDVGDPFPAVQVFALWFPGPGARGQRFGASVQTDDLGRFRMFGLLPGEYVVVADASRDRSDVPSDSSEESRVDFLTTYYPGTPDLAAAQRVRTITSRETPGIDLLVVRGRTHTIAGTVTDSRGRPAAFALGLLDHAATNGASPAGRFSTNERGEFTLGHVAPGRYLFRAVQSQNGAEREGEQDLEVLSTPIEIGESDVEGLVLSTRPPVTITGAIVFEQGRPATLPSRLQVLATTIEPGANFRPPQPAQVRPDLTFTLKGLTSEYLLRTIATGWFLKSVVIGSEDITDTLRQFKPEDHVTIVLSSRGSTLEGTVTDSKGTPASDVGVIMFAEDPAGWMTSSVRMHRSLPDPTGKFKIFGLLPGRYYVVAGSRERVFQPGLVARSYFEELAKHAIIITIGENEKRVIDLRIRDGQP